MSFRNNDIANLYLGGILGFVFTRMVDTLPLAAAGILIGLIVLIIGFYYAYPD